MKVGNCVCLNNEIVYDCFVTADTFFHIFYIDFQSKESLSDHFVAAFMKHHVNPKRMKREYSEIMNEHQAQKLENVGKAKLKKHMKTPRKEKLTTKEKKSARIFEIKPEHQK